MTQLVPLAADSFDKNKVTPGILGFIVFAALAIGVWALMKSMNRHMGKVSFEEEPDPDAGVPAQAPEGGKVAAQTAAATSAAKPGSTGTSAEGPGKKK